MKIRLNFASLLTDTNVKAFIRLLRDGESWNDDAHPGSERDELAFRVRYGGWADGRYLPPKYFDSFDDHPRIFELRPDGRKSSAAGVGQITATTWDDMRARYEGFGPTFKPWDQLACIVAIIHSEGALDDVIAGRLDEAMAKCANRWSSLPGATDKHGAKLTRERAHAVFKRWGGGVPTVVARRPIETQPPAPIVERSRQARPEDVQRIEEKPMAPLLGIITSFGPLIAQLIPQLGKLFIKPEDTKKQRDLDAIQLVLDTIVKAATGDATASGSDPAAVGQAVAAMRADPALKEKVTKEVLTTPGIMELVEVGGGIIKAREHDVATMAAPQPFWKASAVFWISLIMLPMVYWLVGSLIVGGVLDKIDAAGVTVPDWMRLTLSLFGTAWNGESRSGGFNLVVGLVLGGICGVYYGISVTQNKREQAIADETGRAG